MNTSLRQGMFFGANSGIITTTGLITGLVQTSITRNYLIISIMSLAIADSISEAYGIYISKKSEKVEDDSQNPIYALIGLLIMKFIVVISFLLPLLFTRDLKCYKNLYWVIGWSLFLIIIVDYNIANLRDESFIGYLIPHVIIIISVVYLTRYFARMIL
tara:strand:+ start:1574 stop:2050 length:477 start_codon:yes stop_codon:yes gene_type:complete